MTEIVKNLLLEDISARLPYKMKFIAGLYLCEMKSVRIGTTEVIANDLALLLSGNRKETYQFSIHQSEFAIDEIKPILFPFSDITETIQFGGKEVCLMDQFASIFNFDGYQGYYTTWKLDDKKENVTFSIWGGEIARMTLKSFMVTPIRDVQNSTTLGLIHFREVFSLLHRYHIDYRGLIDNGLAVSVHSLDENPYK